MKYVTKSNVFHITDFIFNVISSPDRLTAEIDIEFYNAEEAYNYLDTILYSLNCVYIGLFDRKISITLDIKKNMTAIKNRGNITLTFHDDISYMRYQRFMLHTAGKWKAELDVETSTIIVKRGII
jgi:hypothetical protein